MALHGVLHLVYAPVEPGVAAAVVARQGLKVPARPSTVALSLVMTVFNFRMGVTRLIATPASAAMTLSAAQSVTVSPP